MQVLIASDNQTIATKLRHAVIQHGHSCHVDDVMPIKHSREALRDRQSATELLFLVVPDDLNHAVENIKWFSMQAKVRIVAVGAANDSRRILESLHAGACDYMDDSGDIQSQVDACLQRLVTQSPPSENNGRLIAVTGIGGGSGASFVAANLAVIQAKQQESCGLLDLDIQNGDQAALFDVNPKYTIADLCRNLKNLDRNMLEQSVVQHASGVQLMSAPQHLSEQQFLTPEALLQLTTFARKVFPALMVDMHCAGGASRNELLRSADVIVTVLRSDFPSLRNLRRVLEYWGEIGIDSNRVHVIVNRYDKRHQLATSKVEASLRTNIRHFIPEDTKAVSESINLGSPVVIESPKSMAAASLSELADKLHITSSSGAEHSMHQEHSQETLLSKISYLTRMHIPKLAGIAE